MGTVYITHDDGSKNFTPALDFGSDIIALATRNVSAFSSLKPFIINIQDKMGGFDPENDYLLLAGDPIIIGICTHLFMRKAQAKAVTNRSKFDKSYEGHIKCLKFDRRSGKYFVIKIPY